jgi:formate dehydrogenase maturation protein FdhE
MARWGEDWKGIMVCGFEFCIVRILCRSCGWERPIGKTGQKDSRRALIKIQVCDAPNNLLKAKVKEVAADVPADAYAELFPGYRDLEAEAYEKGLIRTLKEFQPLLEGKMCPRCGDSNELSLDTGQIRYGEDLRY